MGGVVTHRQRPESAKGTVFLNLEDETGMVNVICSPGAWERWRPVARGAPALLVRGRLERVDGVVSVVAEKILPLDLGPAPVVRAHATSADAARTHGAPPSGALVLGRRCEILKTPTLGADIGEETFPPSVVPELGGSPRSMPSRAT